MVQRLKRDLKLIGLPCDLNITLKGYSKTLNGRYIPRNKEVILYHHLDKEGNPIPYKDLLSTAIHEVVHHVQWSRPDFVRYHGVMHDPEFWSMYNYFIKKAEKNELFKPKITIRRGKNENNRKIHVR